MSGCMALWSQTVTEIWNAGRPEGIRDEVTQEHGHTRLSARDPHGWVFVDRGNDALIPIHAGQGTGLTGRRS